MVADQGSDADTTLVYIADTMAAIPTIPPKQLRTVPRDCGYGAKRERHIRAGHAAQNLDAVRRLALNLLRLDRSRTGSVAAKRCLAALDQPYLASLLATALGQ